MSGGEAVPLHVGFQAAMQVMSLLVDVCSRIEIAGSIRRQKAQVKDVELVMQPVSEVALYRRCDELLREGIFSKRLNSRGKAIAWGSRYRAGMFKPSSPALLPQGEGCKEIAVDLFIVLADRQWGPTFLIRTGPGDANQVLVTEEWKRNSNGHQGVLPRGMKFDDGAIWRGGVKLETPEEWDVFTALGLPYIPPMDRSVALYQRWARRRGTRLPGRSFVPTLYQELKWTVKPTRVDTPDVLEQALLI